jgi:hypothetical protein
MKLDVLDRLFLILLLILSIYDTVNESIITTSYFWLFAYTISIIYRYILIYKLWEYRGD